MSLHVYTGCMKTGKTYEVIQKLTEYLVTPSIIRVCFINSNKDTREKAGQNVHSSNNINTLLMTDKISKFSLECLSDFDEDEFDVIGVDEGQFFSDLYECVQKWLNKGKHIYVSGLDGTWQMEPFGQISQLLHLSDTFVKMNAICTFCIQEIHGMHGYMARHQMPKAAFSAKICGSNSVVEIGSTNYAPVCREHFRQNMSRFTSEELLIKDILVEHKDHSSPKRFSE